MPLRAISLKFTDSTLFWGSSASFSILTMKLASLNTKVLKGSSCCCHPFSAHKWWGYKTGSQRIAISLCLQRLVHFFSVSKSVEENQICSLCLPSRFCSSPPSYKVQSTNWKALKRLTQSLSFLLTISQSIMFGRLCSVTLSVLLFWNFQSQTFRNDVLLIHLLTARVKTSAILLLKFGLCKTVLD